MIGSMISSVLSLMAMGFILGIPDVFLVLCIIDTVKSIKSKRIAGVADKSLVKKAIIFGVIFVAIVVFYIGLFMYMMDQTVRHM